MTEIGKKTRVTVGLDFGTYSTKVVARKRPETVAYSISIEDTPVRGYPSFASPSLMRELEGKLYFGADALRRSGGRLYESQKVELLPPRDEIDDLLVRKSVQPGLPPDFLVTCYLSWALHRIRERVESLIRPAVPDISVNLAAPMTHLELPELKARYLRIVGAAWRTAPVLGGESVAELKARFSGAWEAEIPSERDRKYEVLPETVAPLVSMHDDPEVRPGLYVVVDVGAGTSEISVVRMGRPSGQQRIWCFEDMSTRLGGDDFAAIRAAELTPREAKRRVRRLISAFERYLRCTWERGRRKDVGNWRHLRSKWRQNQIFLTGGGAKDRALAAHIHETPPFEPKRPDFKGFKYHVDWYTPARQALQPAPSLASANRSEFHLLAVAHGLSFERMTWPKWFAPAEVPPIPAPDDTGRPDAGWWH